MLPVVVGAKQNGVDSLAFDTLVPKSILQRYVSLLLDHHRIILCGPSGTGKTYMARRFAEHLIIRCDFVAVLLRLSFGTYALRDFEYSCAPHYCTLFRLSVGALVVLRGVLTGVSCICFISGCSQSPLSVWPHLFRGAGHEKRRGEQLKWSLAFRLYIGSFPCAQLPGLVHTARFGRVCFFVYLA